MEDKSLSQNATNHADNVATNKVTETGVNVMRNEIPGYHFTLNCSLDLMHDLLEGVCRYDMMYSKFRSRFR